MIVIIFKKNMRNLLYKAICLIVKSFRHMYILGSNFIYASAFKKMHGEIRFPHILAREENIAIGNNTII